MKHRYELIVKDVTWKEAEVLCHESGVEVSEDYAKKWKSENPDMAEDGLYYFRYIGDERKKFLCYTDCN